ncbi:relaxase/mobilization nuclease domain-containing protein [Nocardioides sp. Bht2]|uniref:relaxase/mobilization nuclease domain-containing protein n=1 Tax=Nocardioides sp. Bht2 TaxID=3392297 RepID=UPI0039B6AD51
MIPNVVKGGNMYGLIHYLRGPGKFNEHENPHVVGGDDFLTAWYGTEALELSSVTEIADYIEEPRKQYGTKVTAQVTEQDPETGQRRVTGYKDAHVWHCSLSLSADEGVLSDEKWHAIARDFMDQMGFTEASGKAPARWVAIRHGLSTAGNDHIHIAASLVREDGTRWDGRYRDFRNAQEACRALEVRHGLQTVAGPDLGLAERGEKPAERAKAARAGRDQTAPKELAERVRAAAVAASSEAEWVRAVRADGMVLKPFFAKGTTDVVTGYRVSLKPDTYGSGFAFYGGKTLGQDLSLPRLREMWGAASVDQASAAAREWQAAFRGQPATDAAPKMGIEGRASQSAAERFQEFNQRLASTPYGDRAAWSDAARDVAGTLSSWARYDHDLAPDLRRAAAVLGRSAQLKRPSVAPGRVVRESPMGTANLFLMARSADKPKIAAAMLMRQVLVTSKALAGYHQAAGDARQAEALRRDVVSRLERVQLAGYAAVGGSGSGATAVLERPAGPAAGPDERARKIAGAFGGGVVPLPNKLSEPREKPAVRPEVGPGRRNGRSDDHGR